MKTLVPTRKGVIDPRTGSAMDASGVKVEVLCPSDILNQRTGAVVLSESDIPVKVKEKKET
jgi:hypothetical protein